MRSSVLTALTLTALLAGACEPGSKSTTDSARSVERADPSSGGEAEADEALFNETVLYVIADGVGYRTPDEKGEASLRIAVDDRFRILEERPGWYRVETEWKEIPAWVPAASVRTATEPAPVHVINERLGNEP